MTFWHHSTWLAFAARMHCWPMSVSTWALRSFSVNLLSSSMAPSVYWCMGLFPRCRTLHFLLNVPKFLSAHLSSLPRPLWVAASPVVYLPPPHPRFLSSAKLLRVHSAPSSWLLMKVSHRSGASIDLGYSACHWPPPGVGTSGYGRAARF